MPPEFPETLGKRNPIELPDIVSDPNAEVVIKLRVPTVYKHFGSYEGTVLPFTTKLSARASELIGKIEYKIGAHMQKYALTTANGLRIEGDSKLYHFNVDDQEELSLMDLNSDASTYK